MGRVFFGLAALFYKKLARGFFKLQATFEISLRPLRGKAGIFNPYTLKKLLCSIKRESG